MALEFRLPDIGEGVVEGEITRWMVQEGDAIREDQPMVEVMTDKATVEIPSPKAGRVAKIVAPAGKLCAVGAVMLIIDEAARVDDALYFSVRPMLAVSQGRLVALSTPFGKRGWFHDEWHGDSTWERVRITAEQCPRITKEFLAEERKALGERWYSQEYLTVFANTIDSVFSLHDIEAAMSRDVKPLFGDRK